MKKQKKRNKSVVAARQRRVRVITLTVAILLIAGAAVTVISKQITTTKASAPKSSVPPKYVTVKVAGHDVQVDPQTGQIKPMTPEKAKEMAQLLKARLNKSTDGLVQVHNTDGSVSMDLQGRAQNVLVARTNDDGSVEHACVDEPLAAAEFLGIDPTLVGAKAPKRATGQKPYRTPAKNSIQ